MVSYFPVWWLPQNTLTEDAKVRKDLLQPQPQVTAIMTGESPGRSLSDQVMLHPQSEPKREEHMLSISSILGRSGLLAKEMVLPTTEMDLLVGALPAFQSFSYATSPSNQRRDNARGSEVSSNYRNH